MSATRARPVYVVRDQDGRGCGHHHRTLQTAANCLAREVELDQRFGPTGTVRRIWKLTDSAVEAVSAGVGA